MSSYAQDNVLEPIAVIDIDRYIHFPYVPNLAPTTQWCPDSSCVLVAARDGTLYLWDIETNEAIFQLDSQQPPDANFERILVKDDLSQIAAMWDDGTVVVWDKLGQILLEKKVIGRPFGRWMMWSPNQEYLLTSEPLHVLDTDKYGTVFVLPTTGFFYDDNLLLTYADGSPLQIWNVDESVKLIEMENEDSGIFPFLNEDTTQILATGDTNYAYLWDIASGAELFRLDHGSIPSYAIWNSSETRILTFSDSVDNGEPIGIVNVWDAVTGEQLFALDGMIAGGWLLDGNIVWSSSEFELELWHVDTEELIQNILISGETSVFARASEDKSRFAIHEENLDCDDNSGLCTARISVWEPESITPLLSIEFESFWWDSDIQWLWDSSHILVRNGSEAIIWNVDTGEKLYRLNHDTDEIIYVVPSPDEEHLMTLTPYTLYIWDIPHDE